MSVDSDLPDSLPDFVSNFISDGLCAGGDVREGRGSLLPPEAWRDLMSAPAPAYPGLHLDGVPESDLHWQIASSFAPAAVSWHANNRPRPSACQRDDIQAMRDELRKAMTGSYSVPPWSEPLADLVRLSLKGSPVSALRVWGLDVNHPSPDLDALRCFLDERFEHSTEDLPPGQHPKFPWETE